MKSEVLIALVVLGVAGGIALKRYLENQLETQAPAAAYEAGMGFAHGLMGR